jgi:hypothetical protein
MIELRIICDDCGRTAPVIGFTRPGKRTERGAQHPKAHSIREKIKADGWRVGQRGGRDWCPDCINKKKRCE